MFIGTVYFRARISHSSYGLQLLGTQNSSQSATAQSGGFVN